MSRPRKERLRAVISGCCCDGCGGGKRRGEVGAYRMMTPIPMERAPLCAPTMDRMKLTM
jgi:hypothetical protein